LLLNAEVGEETLDVENDVENMSVKDSATCLSSETGIKYIANIRRFRISFYIYLCGLQSLHLGFPVT